ncbi:hypothetical protein ACFPIK_12790 [Algoriphagus aquatilis]|uniref:Outer membrane protein beta-barrel domain-containing protein n=1 Tax=Algoriphagus aquatilis TaxID=490186 RepID=A0ABW0BYK0_9BACT
MPKSLLSIILLFLLSPPVYSQVSKDRLVFDWALANSSKEKMQDFIVLPSGQQVFGTVVRNYNYADFEELVFSKDGVVSTYLPQQIQGFGLDNGQIFLSKPLPGNSEPVFLQILVSGPIQLGEYKGGYFLDNGKEYMKLEAYYGEVEKNGPLYKKYIRPFRGTLKQFLVGDCGVALFTDIDRAPYNDQALINLMKSYFDCAQVRYQVHIEKVPMILISPLAGIGLSQHILVKPIKENARDDQFNSPFGFTGFVGVRAHDARRVPRLSTDLRVVFSVFQTELLSSFGGTQAIRTGSEDISETSISIPFALNYSLLKRVNSEIYLGGFLGLWRPSIKQSNGKVDERIVARNEVYLYETPIMLYQGTNFYSGGRLGGSKVFKDNLKLFAELEVAVQPEYYKFSLLQNDAFYNRSRMAFHLGIEF